MAWLGSRLAGFVLRAGVAIVVSLSAAVAARAAVDLLIMERVQQELAKGASAAAFAILEDAIKSPDTVPEAQVDLLAELARLRTLHGDFADAGEALALQAEVKGRIEGALAPELAGLYAAAADAYARSGDTKKALDLAEDALRIDTAYYDCAAEVIARDHARLADLLTALGETARAADERLLAKDSVARCSAGGPSARGVIVNTEFAATTPDSFARVKVFYATDRAPTGSDRPNDYYGGDRGELQYGTVEVTVPRIHKAGEVEAPSLIKLEWSENPERHFVITEIATMAGPQMFADMRATLAERGSDEAFVFVHGYNVNFADAAKRTAQIAYDVNFQGAPILYSWPSAGSTLAYIRDEAVVRLSGRHLLRFLDEIVAQSGARRINIIAHSMGNRAVADALELLATRRSGAGETAAVFDQAIFAAPDEDAALFAEMLKTIRPVATRLTLYGSDNDLALQASKTLHGDLRRAGQGGEGILVADPVDSIDMSVLGEDMLGHSYFAASASALTDISWLFWKNMPPEQRCGMDTKEEPRGRFWQFDPVRCDGPAVLSALTMLKAEGTAALAKLDQILSGIGTGQASEAAVEEWTAIRNAILAVAR